MIFSNFLNTFSNSENLYQLMFSIFALKSLFITCEFNIPQGRINFHQTGGVHIFLEGALVFYQGADLTGLCSSSVTVVGYDLVVSHAKL